MAAQLSWDEGELENFFRQRGADGEVRLSRLVLNDPTQAMEALQRFRKGETFGHLITTYTVPDQLYSNGDIGWVNPLSTNDPPPSSPFVVGGRRRQTDRGGRDLFSLSGNGKTPGFSGGAQAIGRTGPEGRKMGQGRAGLYGISARQVPGAPRYHGDRAPAERGARASEPLPETGAQHPRGLDHWRLSGSAGKTCPTPSNQGQTQCRPSVSRWPALM